MKDTGRVTRPGAPLTSLFERAVGRAATPGPATADDERVYEAAMRVLAERGTRTATMDDVAAAAGIGRATLFRRFGGKDAVFEAAIAHTLRAFLTEIATTFLTVTDPTERITEGFLACLRLRRRFLAADADVTRTGELLAMLSAGDPSPLDTGHRFIAAHIVAGQSEGVLPQADPDIRADAIIRLTLGYLVLPHTRYDLDDEAVARRIARRAIAPLITGRPS
ncbi:TetR/AcrR family transcriptional regulator [Nocardia abscessus]|uniref:TetR/AcrR family transcriptional regulator n=1 Tax=Nocardia abscessus TaxID=120957 RepID=UPI0018941320|nr:TetR/AcrR family transcriptional regulator [Nocardia abscessus]MBF6339935.1 TetR/AcrR family transcriptional regulator [Nocardia abscessus]